MHSAAQGHRFGFSLQQFQKLSYSTRISTREMLSVGYFENSKMGVSLPPYPARDLCLQSKYHDDGERPWAQPLRRSPLVAVRSCIGDQEHRFGFSLQWFLKLSYSTKISTGKMVTSSFPLLKFSWNRRVSGTSEERNQTGALNHRISS
jgi:hypothetical protein